MSDLQILTVKCRLAPSDIDVPVLAATVSAFAAACRDVLEATPSDMTNETRLRQACYRDIRGKHGLSASVAQQAIARVSANRKAAKHTGGKVQDFADSSVQFDERTFALYGEEASMTLLGGRRRISLTLGDWQREQLKRHVGVRRIRSATLCKVRSKGRTGFYLNIQVEVACGNQITPTDWVGVDKGRTDVAHTSTGRNWSGNLRKVVRDRYHRTRRSLQAKASKGTRSSRRRCRAILQRLSGRERLFNAHENHTIARALVQEAKETGAGIVLEDLTGIRNRGRFPKSVRREHHGWSFFQLDSFTAYKARIEGVPVLMCEPHYTSKTCSRCGHLGSRRGKVFRCENCGHVADADRNAADNLRLLGLSVTQPRGPFCALPQGCGTGLQKSPVL